MCIKQYEIVDIGNFIMNLGVFGFMHNIEMKH